ncbi:MAG: membrane bound O-acyl transferase family-domain-containing protein [Planctomycetes bacterium]|nr:membrane bound O-acyl transferase family-domain-containing protein [Planctomycetota bacterium]
MFALAFAILGGLKWLTWRMALRNAAAPSAARSISYLLLWPGLDARAFLGPRTAPPPEESVWSGAAARTLLGALLLWGATRHVAEISAYAAAWTGMAGAVLLVHFGFFDLLALFWQAAGVQAECLMHEPHRARSLAEFWTKRWNTAFSAAARECCAASARERLGARGAWALVFALSGLVHEAVISVPACGGWGLPFGYFTLQLIGALLERSKVGRRFGLGRGLRGRIFALAAVILPAPLLFHLPFVERVVLPLLAAMGAI